MMAYKERLNQFQYCQVVLCIKVIGFYKTIVKMDVEFKYGLMGADTMVSGEVTWPTDMEDLCMLKEMSMKESGLMTKLMGSVYTLILMAADTKVNGIWINNMDMASNSGLTVPSTKEIIK